MEKENFYCPLTKLVYLQPTVAEDGYIYEYLAIQKWLEDNNVSPITDEEMGDNLIKLTEFKKIVDNFLNLNPELREEQFLNKKPYYLFKNEFFEYLLSNNFDYLKQFTGIFLNDNLPYSNLTIVKFLTKNLENNDGDNQVMKVLLDNSYDFDVPDEDGDKPIHVLCKLSNPEIIKYLIEKNIDLESPSANNMRPIHYICLYQSDDSDFIKYILEKNIDLMAIDRVGNLPIHYLVQNLRNRVSLDHFINKGINFEIDSMFGWKPLHIICKEGSSAETIKYFIQLCKDLESTVTESWDEKGCDELLFENKKLLKNERQECVQFFLNKLLNKPVINENYLS